MDANVADPKTLPIQSSMKRKSSAAKVVLGNNCTVKGVSCAKLHHIHFRVHY